MTEKRAAFARMIRRGVSISEACRELGIDRKTGHWWKNGGTQWTKNGPRVIEPIIEQYPATADSGRCLSLEERIVIADGHRAGRSARSLAAELGRAVTTVARELQRNSVEGDYRAHAAHQQALARRARPKARRLEVDEELRALVQHYLDQRWSPEQIAHQLRVAHDRRIAVETIYQALYAPQKCVQRDPGDVLRTGRPHRRPRRRGDRRRPRFIVPITPIDQRPAHVLDRCVPGHWEGDLIVGSYNRSAIGTLVERTTRFTILVHLGGLSRADALRDELLRVFHDLPRHVQRSLTWDQGSEMCHHHIVTEQTGMPVYFCDAGKPWQRPTNENTNGLLRDYFPKSTDLAQHTQADLARVAGEINRRPRKTLDWASPHDLFASLLEQPV